MAEDLEEAFERVNTITAHADQLVKDLQAISTAIDRDYRSGAGPATALLRDSLMTNNLQQSLKNVEQGTRAFGENMEALKHNFLFRGYFKRQEKKNKKQ
ncbi:MAG: hypothetical protein IPL65_18585 [Lewinellaceae bacterium]|nr:hypothetical protein [Lewinellaceae bacterium]